MRRVRARVRGTADRPRLSVFRSGRHISAQLIDDAAGITLVAASDVVGDGVKAKSKQDRASGVGEELASRARSKGIRHCRFDRGRYRYHGLVAALAAGARRGGLTF